MRRLATVATALLLVGLPLAGCASPADPPASQPAPTSAPSAPTSGSTGGSTSAPTGTAAQPVALRRSGGIAGNRDEVTVQPDGSWRRTAKTGAPRTGTLTADQRARLARMAADPALRTEAGRPVPRPECADGLDYRLTAGGTTVAWQDCGSVGGPPRVASQIAAFLLSSTA